MAGMYGMDVDQIRTLGNQMQQKADEIKQIAQAISSQLQSAQWMGPDAERFRSDWQGQHVTALNNVAEAVRGAGQSALNNATEQEATSSR
jgi:uncharacterized protein YukE